MYSRKKKKNLYQDESDEPVSKRSSHDHGIVDGAILKSLVRSLSHSSWPGRRTYKRRFWVDKKISFWRKIAGEMTDDQTIYWYFFCFLEFEWCEWYFLGWNLRGFYLVFVLIRRLFLPLYLKTRPRLRHQKSWKINSAKTAATTATTTAKKVNSSQTKNSFKSA